MSKISKAELKYKLRPLFEGIPSFQGYFRKRGWDLKYDLMDAKNSTSKRDWYIMEKGRNSHPSAANNTWPLRGLTAANFAVP